MICRKNAQNAPRSQPQPAATKAELTKKTTKIAKKKAVRSCLCVLCAAIGQHRAFPGRFPNRHFKAKSQSQGNGCQNGKKRIQNYSPHNHSPDISPAFSNRHLAIFALVAAARAGFFAVKIFLELPDSTLLQSSAASRNQGN